MENLIIASHGRLPGCDERRTALVIGGVMTDKVRDLSGDELREIRGGYDWTLGEFVGFMVGYYAGVAAKAFTTTSPSGDFDWARDK